jgi:hypothetical protein
MTQFPHIHPISARKAMVERMVTAFAAVTVESFIFLWVELQRG